MRRAGSIVQYTSRRAALSTLTAAATTAAEQGLCTSCHRHSCLHLPKHRRAFNNAHDSAAAVCRSRRANCPRRLTERGGGPPHALRLLVVGRPVGELGRIVGGQDLDPVSIRVLDKRQVPECRGWGARGVKGGQGGIQPGHLSRSSEKGSQPASQPGTAHQPQQRRHQQQRRQQQ